MATQPVTDTVAEDPNIRSAAELAADLSVHQVELELQKQELEEAHQSLEASRRRYFCLFDLAPVPYFLFTREGIIAEMNLAAGELLGGTRADAWKRPFALHLAEESRPLFHDHLRRVFNGIVDASTELRLIPGKDVIKHLIAHSSLLPSEGNQPAQVLTAFFDMTAIRESEQREKALQAQLNQSQRVESLGILAGGIAHDFNNLLQAIIGFSDVATQETDMERIRNSIGEIRSASLRGAQLTRQILTFSRRQPLELSTLQVTELLGSFVPTLHRLVRPGIRIRTSFDPGMPCIEADATQLEQVIMNLITNACDALPNEGIIDLQASLIHQTLAPIAGSGDSRLRDAIALSVRDNGLGMPPETLARIFEPFFTTKSRSRGTGLGLAVVHGIVKQHGGEIRVKSKPGVGTEFTVLIPVSAKRTQLNKSPARPAFHAGGQWALLAEDEPFLRSLGEGMLKRLGFQVVTARDGTEALELFRNHTSAPFALFVFDVMMPRRTGIEAYREMLHFDNCPPVVFVSGYPGDLPSEPTLRQRSRFLRKPFREQELADEIQSCMGVVANP